MVTKNKRGNPRNPYGALVRGRPKKRGLFFAGIIRLVRLGLVAGILIIMGGIFMFVYFAKDLPDPSRLDKIDVSQSTKIYDRNGNVVLYDIYGEVRRNVVPFGDFPSYLVYATIAIEDERFYSHPGIDIEGVLRAAVHNVLNNGSIQGGSTITQQFVKNALLTPERTLTRKIKEWVLATELERRYSKDEIMGFYLNHVPYGSVAYGAEAASQIYFGKSVKDITLAQAATLASLTKAPTYYSPYGSNPERLEERKRLVLEKMARLGFIEDREKQQAEEEEITFAPNIQKIQAPHFVMFVREYLERTYGKEVLEKGGLRVTTTLDFELQKLAEEAVAKYQENNKKQFGASNAALAAIDPKTGQILAMVGSVDYYDIENDGNVNVATRERQPGSAFKPFVYAAAFQKGYTPDTVLFDVPTEFATPGAKSYQPRNYDGGFRGPIRMESALAQSLNIPSVKTLYLAGVEEVVAFANKLGITTLRDPSRYGLSLVLGGGEVKLLDLTSAFGVFGQEGIRHPPVFIARVETEKGEVVEEFREKKESVLSPETSRLINAILSSNELRAPIFGSGSPLVVPGYQVAAKTGTTQEYRDGWTVGYTPTLVTGVWVGNNDNRPMKGSADGVNVASPIWNYFMQHALPRFPKEDFKPYEKEVTRKPILDGEVFPENTVHSILYWVRKNDPRGEPPQKPSEDPQFDNWEKGVREWAKMSPYKAFLDEEGSGFIPREDPRALDKLPKLTISSPAPYEVFSGTYGEVEISLDAFWGVSQFDIFLGDRLVGSYHPNPRENKKNVYSFLVLLPEEQKGEQTTLLVRVFDVAGNKTEAQVPVRIR